MKFINELFGTASTGAITAPSKVLSHQPAIVLLRLGVYP